MFWTISVFVSFVKSDNLNMQSRDLCNASADQYILRRYGFTLNIIYYIFVTIHQFNAI